MKEQGAVIRKRGSRLVVEKQGETLAEILTRHTESVSVFGSIQVTNQAMSEMLERGISLSLYSLHGRLKGHLVPEESKNVETRVAQFRAVFGGDRWLEAARAIVEAKLANSAAVLEGYRKNYPVEALSAAAGALRKLAARCAEAESRDVLMGMEGTGAATYFAALDSANRSGIPFEGRRKHPAPDPFNALLSLGYTMAMNELRGLLEGAGLDPYVGFLHTIDYGRPSLALDLLEPFRAPLVDRLTLRLLNTKVLTGEDFARRVSGRDPGSVVLMPGAFARYLERYEEAVREPVKSAPGGLRAAFAAEAAKARNWVRSGGRFEPYREG